MSLLSYLLVILFLTFVFLKKYISHARRRPKCSAQIIKISRPAFDSAQMLDIWYGLEGLGTCLFVNAVEVGCN